MITLTLRLKHVFDNMLSKKPYSHVLRYSGHQLLFLKFFPTLSTYYGLSKLTTSILDINPHIALALHFCKINIWSGIKKKNVCRFKSYELFFYSIISNSCVRFLKYNKQTSETRCLPPFRQVFCWIFQESRFQRHILSTGCP